EALAKKMQSKPVPLSEDTARLIETVVKAELAELRAEMGLFAQGVQEPQNHPSTQAARQKLDRAVNTLVRRVFTEYNVGNVPEDFLLLENNTPQDTRRKLEKVAANILSTYSDHPELASNK